MTTVDDTAKQFPAIWAKDPYSPVGMNLYHQIHHNFAFLDFYFILQWVLLVGLRAIVDGAEYIYCADKVRAVGLVADFVAPKRFFGCQAIAFCGQKRGVKELVVYGCCKS